MVTAPLFHHECSPNTGSSHFSPLNYFVIHVNKVLEGEVASKLRSWSVEEPKVDCVYRLLMQCPVIRNPGLKLCWGLKRCVEEPRHMHCGLYKILCYFA